MSGRLAIDAASATYVVPAAHPDASGVRARLDGIGRRLPEALPTPLDALAAGREDEVWLFRRLVVGVDLDLAADDASLARAWADGVLAALAARMATAEDPGSDGEVMVFADGAAHVAAFVSDLVDGTAMDHWWHARFAGLRPLPASAAIVTALTSEPPRGRRALGRLADRGRMDAVAGMLGDRGCEDVLRSLYPDSIAVPPPSAGLSGPRRQGDAIAEGRYAAGLSSATRSHASASRRLRLAAERERASLVAPSPAPVPVLEAVPAHGRGYPRSRSPEPPSPGEGVDLWTPFGGACLLLRGMVGLGLAAVDGRTRLRALRAGLGAERAVATGVDDALSLLAGVAAESPAPEADSDLGELLVRGLVETGRTDGRAVCIEPTSIGLLVRDPSRDVWLAAGDADNVRCAIDVLTELGGDAPSTVPAPSPVDDGELAFWSLPEAPPVNAVAGRALVRDLTARLAGFERSSPGHVWRNLLDRGASLAVGASTIRADLRPAPLDVVLLLAGFHGLRFDVPWLGEVELALPR